MSGLFEGMPIRGVRISILTMDMGVKRIFKPFVHKEAAFRICCSHFDIVTQEIIRQRSILENYIRQHQEFQSSLKPLELKNNAPDSARRMAQAAKLVGVGPMAAVAGTMAQLAAEAAIKAGDTDVIIENGGDIYLQTNQSVTIGFYSGPSEKLNQLAFELQPADTPISICSSSGKMGHSMSLGQCDLATVVSQSASLADAAATQAANLVKAIKDVESVLEQIAAIKGITGVLIVKDGHIGLAGALPPLVRKQSR